ncbi:VWA domain-containing protein [Rhodobacteraceae bacterium NNCM2]|nr:VWA domain-containing protein [Coraliihabitans acroporae]
MARIEPSAGDPSKNSATVTVKFLQDERGGITVFTIILMILMLVLGGMGIDLIRHEIARADLHNALDRGVLAATNLSEDLVGTRTEDDGSITDLTEDEVARRVVAEYLATRNHPIGPLNFDVQLTSSPTARQVAASAQQPVDTIFFRLAGLKQLDANVRSGAEQAIGKTEIALVLDVSGSMGEPSTTSPGTKIAQMKDAAKEFVRTVLHGDNANHVLVSIIPYSSRTSLSMSMAGMYNISVDHDYSRCIDYRDLDFTSPAIPLNPFTPYRQSQEYIESGSGDNRVFGCPHFNNAITPYSNSVDELVGAIEALTTEKWTASYIGMKWGAAMLDPGSRAIVDAKISANQLPDTFAGFPHDWDDVTANKFVVLMTDGVNTNLNRIRDEKYNAKESPAEYYHENAPGGDKYTAVNGTNGNLLLQDICEAVKTQPKQPIIYTIGFELNVNTNAARTAKRELKKCALDPSPDARDPYATHFEVEGVEISTAFQIIAEEIKRLKLTF